MSAKTILLVDDNPKLGAELEPCLQEAGYDLRHVDNGQDALRVARSVSPDVVFVQHSPPLILGTELTRLLQQEPKTRHARIVVLSPDESGCTLAECRAAGVDECIKRQLSPDRLVARLESIPHRESFRVTVEGFRFEHHGLVIDTNRFEVLYKGRTIPVTVRELQLLVALAQRAGEVLTREDLLEILGQSGRINERNIDVHMTSIRKKLGDGGGLIVTVFGVGYRLHV